MSGVRMCRVDCIGGREGAWWQPAGGIFAPVLLNKSGL